ncbi:hypothetical protein P175DRAFT_0503003 [Aspergillus ochraceoroseus IBT 24754]|uniref:Uncharacterized protein n=2 Tax=Aspergillus ochraceoroseus TaxID=138278 RepID=A0A2T5LT59_9EURO|nr:uncharacterized protein P175DRAFT_0503003 [Aspergillus ochraceoroseus IBT 24754]KKK23423.1 hypothetical protein AOCH_004370 [Aspergillus ochraceoroseus]PTU19469.1 hypothetical protein P175DRAFT_0503003 [Aspergillus ochraceoroseus IBT 24754]
MSQEGEKSLKSVLITGCSAGGIGSALVEEFHDRGLHVFATARSPSKMAHLENFPHVTLLKLDVQSPIDIAAAVEAVTAKTGGKLDYLVNNSGQGLVMPAIDTDLEEAKKLFDVNFWGAVAVIQAFSPLVIAAKGSIVNVSSVASLLNVTWNIFYNSSKAALRIYSETLRLEMAPLGVKVVTVMAGTVATNITANTPKVDLPSDSLYRAASKEINDLATGVWVKDAPSPAEFAKNVVNEVLGGASGMIWKGKMASISWFLTTFMPTWVIDHMLLDQSGIKHMS